MNNKQLPYMTAPLFNTAEDNMDLLFVYHKLDCLLKNKEESLSQNFNKDEIDYNLLSVIIPVDDSNSDEISNIQFFLKKLINIGIKNVLIVHNNINFKIDDILKSFDNNPLNIKNIVLNDEKVNPGKLVNFAVKLVDTDYIAISKSPLLIENSFVTSLSMLKDGTSFIYPADKKILLSYEEFDEKSLFNKKNFECEDSNLCDVLFCKKDDFLELGGFNTSFKNLDFSNLEFSFRVNMSTFRVNYLNNEIIYLNTGDDDSDDEKTLSSFDEELLMKLYNLTRFDDLNLLTFCNEDTFYNSIKLPKPQINRNSEYKISVIIPSFNCERFYMDRCIYSLFNQSIGFENIEVIIVDDASSNVESKEIIKEYSEKYENITSIFRS